MSQGDIWELCLYVAMAAQAYELSAFICIVGAFLQRICHTQVDSEIKCAFSVISLAVIHCIYFIT